jgi:protein-S-isoprenylcysteine O-methyltransferase Ste14
VVVQVALILLVLLGPRTAPGLPAWTFPPAWVCHGLGALLLAGGAILLVAGARALGSRLTPLPHPKDDAVLLAAGPYRIVRHPMYGGVILMAFGWALWVRGWLTLGYAGVVYPLGDPRFLIPD